MTDENRDFASVPVVWEPKEDSRTRTRKFMKIVENKYNVKLSDYWDLHKWSVENVDKFWGELFEFAEIIHSKPYHQVIDLSVPMHQFQEWFAGAKMNYAENLLRYRDDRVALVVAGEDRETEKVTYAEIYEEVKLYAAALRKQGVKKGDMVACYMSNRKEAIFAMIAATSLGAIWVGVLPLLGAQAVLSRFTQVKPSILFTIDRFPHNKEDIDMLPRLRDIANGIPSFQKIIIVASKPESKKRDISGIRNSCFLDDFLETGRDQDGSVPEMVFEQVDFTHPLFIMYTSGTTGLPKVLVHNFGILMTVVRDFWLQNNGDRNTSWYTMSPSGWASWNMFSSMLFMGLKLLLFEGLPYYLSPTFFWDLVEEHQISHLLIVTSVLDDMEKKNYVPREGSCPAKFIMSGGSVVKPHNYDFAYNKLKCEIFSSCYGSTEVGSTSLFHDQTQKIYRGEIPGPSLGVEIQCLDDEGNPVYGEIGELVYAKPVPSLLLGIWEDHDDRSKLKKAYFEKYPGKFLAGDLAIINPVTKGVYIYGRSDDTLKQRGCRFGCADIYTVVSMFPEIYDSICVAHYNRNRVERAVLFLQMRKGYTFEESLVERLRSAITKELSVRHLPEVILETADIPHNLNGKKMESIVKKIINKMPYNADSVINPSSLENFIDLPELGEFS